MIIISVNEGKRFEQNWKSSVEELDDLWIYRLKDNAASFSGGSNTRFASHNMCDYIMFDDYTRTLYCTELKSTKGTSVSLSMIRENQIKELTEASKHMLVAGFLVNFRNENNDNRIITIRVFKNFRSITKSKQMYQWKKIYCL